MADCSQDRFGAALVELRAVIHRFRSRLAELAEILRPVTALELLHCNHG